jgi:hypothetical protein
MVSVYSVQPVVSFDNKSSQNEEVVERLDSRLFSRPGWADAKQTLRGWWLSTGEAYVEQR